MGRVSKIISRHQLSQALVREQIAKKIHSLEELRVSLVKNELAARARGRLNKDQDKKIDEWIARERDYYSGVSVIRTHVGYLLIYEEGGLGTGPFKTLADASGWFFKGGR